MTATLERLRGGVIVSVQPVRGGPLDRPDIVRAMALAALAGGAAGLRIEGLRDLAAVRAVTDRPIIGLIKRDLPGLGVRITPLADDVRALAYGGADIVAVDATARPRPAPLGDLLLAIRDAGRLAMADLADAVEAQAAVALGFPILGTTLAGYTGGGPEPEAPDLALVRELAKLGRFTIAEGNVRTPELAAAARAAGADAVCVGSAITRPEHATAWFVGAVRCSTPSPGTSPARSASEGDNA
jgi:putative N-acetylmannosamine-6-phosphate epimerase